MDFDFGVNQGLVEELFLRYRENPSSVDAAWKRYFDGLVPAEWPKDSTSAGTLEAPREARDTGNGTYPTLAYAPPTEVSTPFVERRYAADRRAMPSFPPGPDTLQATELQDRVTALINAYRSRGHLFADLDPLGLVQKPEPELTLERFGLAEVSLDTLFSPGDLAVQAQLSLEEILVRLRETYTRAIGVEFAQIEDPDMRDWLRNRMESTSNRIALTKEQQLRILERLTQAETFEQFLHTSFVNAKRFSLEGAESIIPLLDLCIEHSADLGVDEIVIGMAHRGRLNVLINVMGKSPRELFAYFDDKHPELYMGTGDVKYHLGCSHDYVTQGQKKVHLTLAFNPSHLEFVNPVVEGRVRAKQDRHEDADRERVLPLLIHGDAAFVGQGICAETLNLSLLEGYRTGGTIHIVINNQIGFTTSVGDARSTRYCTDITRMLRCPVFHVNGEDPEAVAQVVALATEFRQKFKQDVVIDLYGYRKYGHNEADEPRFTQPIMYAAIDAKPTVREIYVRRLAEKGDITPEAAAAIQVRLRDELEAELSETRRTGLVPKLDSMGGVWKGYKGGPDASVADVPTALTQEAVNSLLERLTTLPSGFTANRKVREIIDRRANQNPDTVIDWGTAESIAFGSLLERGTSVRLSGQDVRRGTFSHRQAVLYDINSGAAHAPLMHLAEGQGRFEIFDSPLSEAGVLGFEYGYSLDSPDGLVLWEAQFGDFANGAQVIIDQFLVSGEDKWHRLSGLTLLLPHGFEGSGPEHSSARLERFLVLASEDNIQVCNLTTPAQYFHVLRRQVIRPWRKPLILMSPKALLRDSKKGSKLRELWEGKFEPVIADTTVEPSKVTRVLLCSGKVYYDLIATREAQKANHVAIVRVEQLYPLRVDALNAALSKYDAKAELVWVQEEPWNMGAWYAINARLPSLLGGRALRCVARAESASPATGSMSSHKLEQRKLVEEAFA